MRHDRVLQGVLLLQVAALAIFLAWPGGGIGLGEAVIDAGVGRGAFWTFVQCLCFFLAVGWGLRRLGSTRERLFWSYLAAGFGFWLAAEAVRWWLLDGESPAIAVAIDSLHLAFYLSLIFAIDSRPDIGGRNPDGDVDRQLNLWGAIFFAFALLIYFVHIPSNLAADEYRAGWLSLLLYIGLDVFLVLRLLYIARRTRSARWAVLYRLLLVALVGFVIVDGMDYLQLLPGAWVPRDTGPLLLLSMAVPLLPMTLAARARHLPFAEPAVADAGWRREPLGPLVLYAVAFPLMHLLLHYFGAGNPASHSARDLLTISYFVVLGIMAVWQLKHRDESRRRAQRQLRESEDNYRQLVESSSNAIVVEQEGEVVYANDLACRLLGIVRLPIPASLADLGLPSPPTRSAVRSGEGSVDRESSAGLGATSCRLKIGDTETDLLVSYHPVILAGQPAWQMIARDVTRLRALRRQYRRLARLATLGELAATFSHEIRRPMAMLEMGCHQLDRSSLDTEGRATFADIELAIERIEKIVAGLHDFSHLAEPQLETVDLAEVLETALRTMGDREAGGAPRLARRFAHRDARVRVDRHQILQVLVNLLDNARHAAGGEGEVVVETQSDERRIDLAIIDHGPGIDPEILERIFDPFFTTRPGGTGLGLAVVSRILGQHRCWHGVESMPGKGTRFMLSFPLAGVA